MYVQTTSTVSDASLSGGACLGLCVRGADGHCTLSAVIICITCRSVTQACHGAWERKRSHVLPHSPDLPLLWVAGICLVFNPTAAWRFFSPRTPGEREGKLQQIWPRRALGGEVGLLWALLHFQPAVCLWDKRRCGRDVWWVVVMWLCVCAQAASDLRTSFVWLVDLIKILDARAPGNAYSPSMFTMRKFMAA